MLCIIIYGMYGTLYFAMLICVTIQALMQISLYNNNRWYFLLNFFNVHYIHFIIAFQFALNISIIQCDIIMQYSELC